jgi:hypothetical protein
MKKGRTLKEKILLRISLKRDKVFLRDDFDDLGGYDQVGRALKQLIEENKILKIGYGLYAKTKISPINGTITPQASLPELAWEALTKLGVNVSPSKSLMMYNSGKTTQVPTGRVVAVDKRVSRKITYKGAVIYYEQSA